MHGMSTTAQRTDHILRRRIGVTVQSLMQLRGINVAELTRRAPWTQESKTSRLINGHASWRDNDLVAVAQILGVSVGVLFEMPHDALVSIGVPVEVADALLTNTFSDDVLDITDDGEFIPRYAHLASDQPIEDVWESLRAS